VNVGVSQLFAQSLAEALNQAPQVQVVSLIQTHVGAPSGANCWLVATWAPN